MAQPMTRLLKISRTATRYNQPWAVSTQVTSVTQTWLGRRTTRVHSRLGAIGPPCRLSVVMERYLERCRAKIRSSRMSRAMDGWDGVASKHLIRLKNPRFSAVGLIIER